MTEVRARADRTTEEATQRRRRDDLTIDGSQRLKLPIPPEVSERLKAEGRTPYWANDEGNRIYQLTKMDDYDKVEGVAPVTVVVNQKTGETCQAHLLSKPTRFVEEDRQKVEAARRETEAALLRGKNPNDPIAGDDSFYADEANSIRRGVRSP
jgi:hypothetical protein